MKFLRNPKSVIAQRSRARHLAHARRPKPEVDLAVLRNRLSTEWQWVYNEDLIEALSRLSARAMADYLEWCMNKTREKNREETAQEKAGPKKAGTGA
jgi:hypothetical protein